MGVSSYYHVRNGDTSPPAPVGDADEGIWYWKNGTLYFRAVGGSEVSAVGVPTARTLNNGSGIATIGDLSADRTIALANRSNNTFMGNVSGGAAPPSDLSPTAAKSLLGIGVADVSGLGSYATKSVLTGPVTADSTGATAIGAQQVTNAMLAASNARTLKGNNSAIGTNTNSPADLTVAQYLNMANLNIANRTQANVSFNAGAGSASELAFVTWSIPANEVVDNLTTLVFDLWVTATQTAAAVSHIARLHAGAAGAGIGGTTFGYSSALTPAIARTTTVFCVTGSLVFKTTGAAANAQGSILISGDQYFAGGANTAPTAGIVASNLTLNTTAQIDIVISLQLATTVTAVVAQVANIRRTV